MNERIKELARQAGFNDFPDDENGVWITDGYWSEQLERFAELVRQDEREQWNTTDMAHRPNGLTVDVTDLINRAIKTEREACAKLCEEREIANLYGVKECAAAIRGRT